MVEITEYALVLLSSSLLAGASVSVFAGYSAFEQAAESQAAFSALANLASVAIDNGTSRAALTLPESVVRCSGGILSFETSTGVQTTRLSTDCTFSLNVSRGVHLVSFRDESSTLTLSVT